MGDMVKLGSKVEADTCTMCGSFCALDNVNGFFSEGLGNGPKR